jgi:hypothetical protein
MTQPTPTLLDAQGAAVLSAEDAAATAATAQTRAEIAAIVALALSMWDEENPERVRVVIGDRVAKLKLSNHRRCSSTPSTKRSGSAWLTAGVNSAAGSRSNLEPCLPRSGELPTSRSTSAAP